MDISAKERSSNFSLEEVEKLKQLIEKHRDVLFSKKTDGVSFNLKESAWKDIHQVFNANATVHRSIKQLKYKFDNLKKMARKDASKERQERRRTGGGRPELPPASPNTDWMRSIIVLSSDGMEAKYDDDVIKKPKSPTEHVKDPFINTSIYDETPQTVTEPSGNCHQPMETEVQFINNNTETIDATETESANMLPVFDSGTPASLLRRPISSPLKRPRDRSCNTTMVTPQCLRKSFKVLNDQKLGLTEHKKNIIDQTNIREEQEFQQRLKHKDEMHKQAYRHNEERHAAEIRILNLKAQLLEIEIEKLNK